MSLFLFIVPLINLIPVVATTGALFFVGLMLFPSKKDLKEYTPTDIIAVSVMVLVTIWTFGLDKAMFAGFFSFLVLFAVGGKWRNMNVYLVGSTAILLLSILLSK